MNNNNNNDTSNEVNIMQKLLRHVELQLSMMEDMRRFTENLVDTTVNKKYPYLFHFYDGYSKYIDNVLQHENFLVKKRVELEQQLKSLCKHEYIEDYIDGFSCGAETSIKITYCEKCGMTF